MRSNAFSSQITYIAAARPIIDLVENCDGSCIGILKRSFYCATDHPSRQMPYRNRLWLCFFCISAAHPSPLLFTLEEPLFSESVDQTITYP